MSNWYRLYSCPTLLLQNWLEHGGDRKYPIQRKMWYPIGSGFGRIVEIRQNLDNRIEYPSIPRCMWPVFYPGTLGLGGNRKNWGVAKFEAPRGEAPKAPRGWGLGRGFPLPSRLGGLGERRELPQRGPGPSPGRKRFSVNFPLQKRC